MCLAVYIQLLLPMVSMHGLWQTPARGGVIPLCILSPTTLWASCEQSAHGVDRSHLPLAAWTAVSEADGEAYLDCTAGRQEPLVSEEALQLLWDTPELDYLTHVVFRMYENKR